MAVRVILAGHNLDRDLLLEIRGALSAIVSAATPEAAEEAREQARRLLASDNWTPETLSAAYARVSRDPQSVTELRALARSEVERARRSNESIVFGLGHSSVAEHAVLNFDILGLSRLAVETLERGRLSSYTEKSQRYILLEEDWVLPEEIRGGACEPLFRRVVAAQQDLYHRAYDRLLPHVQARAPEAASEKKNRRALEGLAKEDARYCLGLCTTVQLGETINARSLEGLIARCRASALREVNELGDALYNAAASLAPSLIKYVEPTPYLRNARAALAREVTRLVSGAETETRGAGAPEFETREFVSRESTARAEDDARIASDPAATASIRLLATTEDPDGALIAALLFAGGAGPAGACRDLAGRLDGGARRRLVESHLRWLGLHDSLLREYEQVDLTYELVVSASCFAQLKRHRMATLIPLPYDPALGITIPDAFEETGLAPSLRLLAEESAAASQALGGISPAVAPYCLLNAHRRRVLFKLNAREMHHLSRLREDTHAQWDIRRVAIRMLELAREKMPLTLLLAAGKDRFQERRGELFPE